MESAGQTEAVNGSLMNADNIQFKTRFEKTTIILKCKKIKELEFVFFHLL